jgi:hypothetical protein
VIGTGYIYSIFIVENGIKIFDHDIVGVADFDHVPDKVGPVDCATIPVEDDVVHIIYMDHSIQFRVPENIVVGDKFYVGIVTDDHIIRNGDIALGKDDDRHQQQ